MLRDNQLHSMKSLHLGLSYSLRKPFTFTSFLPPARNFIAACRFAEQILKRKHINNDCNFINVKNSMKRVLMNVLLINSIETLLKIL
jgi:hypothetical protein